MSLHCRSVSIIAVLLMVATRAFAADVGFSHETQNQWRVSKLAGVSIYGPENQMDGTVVDVLIGETGQAEYVIIGVGGFLGIDQKDVAIPFARVKFTATPILPPANPAGFDNTSGSAADPVNGDITDTSATTSKSGMAMATTGIAASNGTLKTAITRNSGSPDHGIIDMSVDQLESAPTFKFAH